MRGHQIMLVSYIRLPYKIITLQQSFFLTLDLTIACTALFTNAHMPLFFLLCSHLENVNLLHYK